MKVLSWILTAGQIVYELVAKTQRRGLGGSAHPVRRAPRRRGSRPGGQPRWTVSIEFPGRGGGRAAGTGLWPRSPEVLARAADRCWIPSGRAVRLGGLAIPGGMIYCGTRLSPVGGWLDRDPALIDPSLPVVAGTAGGADEALDYWPSYSEIPALCRGAYLRWLAEGRADPEADIGYVFLFFYGLERRLLFDLRYLPERQGESALLLAEVERLLAVYPENRSLQSYGRSLLQVGRVLWQPEKAHYDRPPSFRAAGRGSLPIDVLLAVGQLAAEGKPIPGDWALAWVQGHPETRLRTAARRCRKEFRELFLIRFGDRFGAGFSLPPNKRLLRLSHHPASRSFGGPVEIPMDDLPDVGQLSRPLRPLREIAEAASSDLESYSRFVGRNRESATSLQALALLPPELAANRPSPELQRLRAWMAEVFDGRPTAVAPVHGLMDHWPCARDDRMSKRELGALSRLLELLGYGIEPDPRFGGAGLGADQKAVLFRLGSDRPSAATSSYRAATLLLQLATAVAASDGEVSPEEEHHLEAHLERSMDLSPGEVQRLQAHLQWLLASSPSLGGLKGRLARIDEPGRRQLAEFAVAVAAADGVIDPGEVATLGKVYGLLGFDADQVDADLHALVPGGEREPAREPVTVRPAEAEAEGYAIPPAPEPSAPAPPGGFRLDMERIERTLAETKAVSSVLAEVFVDQDEPAWSPAAGPGGDATESTAGLDAAHAQLLRALEGRSELGRDEFEELATELGLLPDGALETLNEAAFERVDAPLLGGDERLWIDHNTLEEMTR